MSHKAGVSEKIKQHSFGEPRGAGRNEDVLARMYWRAARALTEPYYYLVAQPSAGSVSSDCRGRALGNRRRIASFQKLTSSNSEYGQYRWKWRMGGSVRADAYWQAKSEDGRTYEKRENGTNVWFGRGCVP